MDPEQAADRRLSPFVWFSREEWSRLRTPTSLSLSEDDVRDLRRMAGHLSAEEATEVYLPLSWLLYLHVSATQDLYQKAHAFLSQEETEVPYVVGLAGSVAAGKSTVAQVLQSRGLMDRKGFPESYNLQLLLRFLADVKSGLVEVNAPIYSHLTYDILPDQVQAIARPDVLI